MSTHSLPKSTLRIIDHYRNLKAAEGKYIRCPYFRNPLSGRDKWGLTAYSGKGSAREIEDELKIVEKLEGVIFAQMRKSKIRDIMVKRRLGIECSGFIARVLDAYCEELYKKSFPRLINFNLPGLNRIFFLLRPYTHIDVSTILNPINASEIEDIEKLMPGDIMRFKDGIDHAALITKTERDENSNLKKINYAHSVREGISGGIKLGTVEFTSSFQDLRGQKWSEKPENGHSLIEKGNPRLYRLKIFKNY